MVVEATIAIGLGMAVPSLSLESRGRAPRHAYNYFNGEDARLFAQCNFRRWKAYLIRAGLGEQRSTKSGCR